MNDTADPAPSTTEATAPRKSPTPAPRGGNWLGVVALLALAALGLAGWHYHTSRQDIDNLRQELAKRLADVDAQTKASRMTHDQLREATRDASVKLGVLESKLAESQGQQIALEALYQDLSRNRDEWAFAEIEQTLLVANQQLQLAGNVRVALIALQAADTRLAHMNRPQHASLRKAINDDIARLKAAPFVDTVGLAVRIDTVVAAVDKLPLAAHARAATDAGASAPAPAADEKAWSRVARDVWNDLKQLVRVQRMESELPLLAPTQQFFLRENLKLRLLNARMALLTRDQATFRGDLKSAHEWMARYFDTGDKAVSVALASLAALQKSEVTIELPDLSATLNALRSVSSAAARAKP